MLRLRGDIGLLDRPRDLLTIGYRSGHCYLLGTGIAPRTQPRKLYPDPIRLGKVPG
jgi:hypothetical protein